MIFDENNKPILECNVCSNNHNKICPCVIFSGNTTLPNLFNKKFPTLQELKKLKEKIKNKENIYEANLL